MIFPPAVRNPEPPWYFIAKLNTPDYAAGARPSVAKASVKMPRGLAPPHRSIRLFRFGGRVSSSVAHGFSLVSLASRKPNCTRTARPAGC